MDEGHPNFEGMFEVARFTAGKLTVPVNSSINKLQKAVCKALQNLDINQRRQQSLANMIVGAYFVNLSLLTWYLFRKTDTRYSFRFYNAFSKTEFKSILRYGLFVLIGAGGALIVAKVDTIMVTSMKMKIQKIGKTTIRSRMRMKSLLYLTLSHERD